MSLLEEGAIDSIPILILDPKGKMGNMLLTFLGLNPEEFLPRIDNDEAARSKHSPEEFASSQAAAWKNGRL